MSTELEVALEGARKAAGLDDFGTAAFREPLARYLECVEREARLTEAGRFSLEGYVQNFLVNRLRIEEGIRRHPEILDETIRPPLVVVGLQRTGTTKLHRMMASDPDAAFLSLWKVMNPAPLPGERPGQPEPRIAAAEAASKAMREGAPAFFAAHPMLPHEAEEEVLLLALSFMGMSMESRANVPSFAHWLEEQDHRPAYSYLKRVLQYLQWQEPASRSKRWVLKTPGHLERADALLEAFPGATIIHCHRDPAATLPSLCGLIRHLREIYSDQVDLAELGRFFLGRTARLVRKGMDLRRELGDRFVDVQYAEIVSDPLSAIRRIYAAAGSELSPDSERPMRQWEANNPQHRHGRHRYTLEEFGLERSEVEAEFSDYIETLVS